MASNFVVSASDPDGDVIVFNVTSNPRFGTLNAWTPNITGEFFFTPNPRATSNTDSFTYTVSDGTYTASATVTINLVPLYYPPVANSASVLTESNQAVSIT